MTEQPGFCTACGTSLVSEARFCTSCGQENSAIQSQAAAVTAAVAPPQDPDAPTQPAYADAPISNGELVISTIPNAMLKAGFMGVGTKPYILAMTDRRVIFARITNEMMKQLVNDARSNAKQDGKGFLGQWGAQLAAYSKFAERYAAMSPDQILAETPENFAIDRSTIRTAKLKTGYEDENGAKSSDRLVIKTTGKTYTVVLGNGIGPAKNALLAARMI